MSASVGKSLGMTSEGLSFDDFVHKLVNAKPKPKPVKARKRGQSKKKPKTDGGKTPNT
jgi:hypothetical protein